MAFVKKIWTDRIAEYINRRTLTKEDGSTELVTVARSEGTVSQEGDAFNADNMNDLEERVANEFNALNSSLTYECTSNWIEFYTNKVIKNNKVVEVTLYGGRTDGYIPGHGYGFAVVPSEIKPSHETYGMARLFNADLSESKIVPITLYPDGGINIDTGIDTTGYTRINCTITYILD